MATETERTADGRFVVVDGRRWRASDPSIPPPLRDELVRELMAARRAVASGRRDGDGGATAAARRRVQHAKVALGERGDPWWEPVTPAGRADRLRATALALATARAPDRTICPSDVARAAGGDSWRTIMNETRAAVRVLAGEGLVEVLQKGKAIDVDQPWRGPVRVRLRRELDDG